MYKHCPSCFFACAKKSSETNTLWGGAATGGTAACLAKGTVDLAGCTIHPLVPFSIGFFVGAVSCIIKSVEICFRPDTADLNDELNSEENTEKDTASASRRKSV